ncbi:MAG TPA: GIY-YIG nuclease family protein [Candidatus Paceibacterota bacterium]|nr:GIY-YIG nuclease family protein [Candidatus Paceibacterota bacterium]
MEKLAIKLPDSPGVYMFKKGRSIIYIGKATSLRDRVRSYFSRGVIETRGQAIVNMVEQADGISVKKTDSVLEALILESTLIKKHQPKYNIREKDDKSYFYVVVTSEDYPRIKTMRGRDLFAEDRKNFSEIFGPFPHGGELKEAIKIIRKIFPFREKCLPAQAGLPGLGKACFEAQIGLCPGVCEGRVTKADYARNIKNIKLFFEGKKTKILNSLERMMHSYANVHEFEKANEIKKQIFGLKHIEDVALIKNKEGLGDESTNRDVFRIEAYDVSHMGGINRIGVMTVLENGEIKRSDYRKFKIKDPTKLAGDTNDLKQILDRRFFHEEWRLPDLIVVDGAVAQKNAAERILEGLRLNIPVVAVTKDEYHRPKKILGKREIYGKYEREILIANSEAHRFAVSYHKKIRKII